MWQIAQYLAPRRARLQTRHSEAVSIALSVPVLMQFGIVWKILGEQT